jgi:hypothetical protein
MQVSLMGSLQRGQGMIPVSARLNSASECVVGMMLPLRWAGAQHSQSSVGADLRDDDGASMLFRLAESVVNIAHIGKVR